VKLVFCGTPQFAVPTLNALLASGPRNRLGRLAARPPRRPQCGNSPLRQSSKPRSPPACRSPSRKKFATIPSFARSLRPSPRRHRRRRLRAHHSSLDAGSAALRLHQPARVSAAQIPRRRAHPVGRGHGRRLHRQYHHASRRRPRYRPHSLQQTLEIAPTKPPSTSSISSPAPARRWWWKPWPASPPEPSNPSRRTTPSPPSPRSSIAKTAAWTLPPAPPRAL
jgi:hypothetical protein